MDFDQIQKLMDKLEASKLTKLSIKQGGFELQLEKESMERAPCPPSYSRSAPAEQMSEHAESSQKEKKGTHHQAHNTTLVKSPMVGTFYRSPGPTEPKFVNVGDQVHKGQTILCIIEAMKVMNEIKADCTGKIVEILVDDGHSVEFGQPLYRIETHA